MGNLTLRFFHCPGNQGDHENGEENEEKDFGDGCCSGGNASETENCSN